MAANQPSNSSFGAYQFEPLDPALKQMRVVKIQHQASHSDTPKCTIQTINLNQNTTFQALSYAWGSPQSHLTYLNGQPFSITKNLSDFLQTVQTDDEFCKVPYFIDQLCIDQDCDQERNHQVAQMGEIYSSAQRTVAWLGLAGSPSEESKIQTGELIRSGSNSNLEALCSVSYWSRVWIIQEVILAPSVLLLLGQDNFRYHSECLPWLRSRRQNIGATILAKLLHDIDAQHRNKRTITMYTWQEIAMTFSGSQCKIPHDKIYGMLGIVHPGLRVEPDYQKPLREVYEEIMEAERIYRGYSVIQCRMIRRLWQRYLSLPDDVI